MSERKPHDQFACYHIYVVLVTAPSVPLPHCQLQLLHLFSGNQHVILKNQMWIFSILCPIGYNRQTAECKKLSHQQLPCNASYVLGI